MVKHLRELATLAIIFLLIVIVRIFISFYFAGPQSLGDAAVYDSIAQTVFDGTFTTSGAYSDDFPPGYPLLMSFAYLFGADKVLIYHIQLILNAIVAALIIFPTYFLLKDWCSKEIAICGSCIVATLPTISRSTGLLMSENLFLPLTVFTLYFIYRAFSKDNKGYFFPILAGLSTLALVLTRWVGLAMVIAFIVGFIVYLYLQKKSGRKTQTALKYTWPAIAGCFIPLAIWQLLTFINTNRSISYRDTGPSVSNTIEILTTDPFEIIRVIVLQIDYVLLSSYVIFTILAAYLVINLISHPIHLTKYLSGKFKSRSDSLRIMAIIALVFIFFTSIFPLPNLITYNSFMYGRFYDPIIPFVFIFGIIGLQVTVNQRNTIKNRSGMYFIGASMLASIFAALTLSWNTHFDILQNASLPYLYLLPTSIGITIILALFGILFPSILVVGRKSIHIMRGFFIAILVMNVILSVPMYQTEIQFSNNFDNIGVIGKVIDHTIDPDAVIIFDNSSLDPPWDLVFYALIDYWVVNDLRSINLRDIALSGDYAALQDGGYIITTLAGDRKPVYTSPAGLSLYHL